jgi:hypothetical protein
MRRSNTDSWLYRIIMIPLGADLPGAGLEPAWGLPQGIFIPLQLSLLHAFACICGLGFTFAVP